jgi:hypothetical protein
VFVKDAFEQVSYSNNNGMVHFQGTSRFLPTLENSWQHDHPFTGDWVENDPQGGGASSGSVRVVADGGLTFDNDHGSPSAYRIANLTGRTSSSLGCAHSC